MQNLSHIKKTITAGDTETALCELENYLDEMPDSSEAWYLKGRVYWQRGDRSQAMSCYARSSALDPDGPASYAMQQARDIADFFNPDLLNP